MREIGPYLKAIGRVWWALMSCAVFTIFSVIVLVARETDVWQLWTYAGLAFLMLFIASYRAWRKEYLANVTGPEIMIRWTNERFIDGQSGKDKITFDNSGPQPAIDVAVEKFSRSDLQWTYGIQIPVVGSHESRSVSADFDRATGFHASSVGYMYDVLAETGDQQVWFYIRYRSLRGTHYRRRFTLSLVQVGRDLEISCLPGELEVHR